MDSSISKSIAPTSPNDYGNAVQICIVCANEAHGPICMFCGSKNFKVRSEKTLEVKARPKLIYEGFLYKQGGSLKNWRRRYFALTELGQLSYHKTDQLHIKQLDEEMGSFSVRGAIIETFDLGVHEEREGYVMGILPGQGLVKSDSAKDLKEVTLKRQYLLEAPGYVDRQKWIDAFLSLGANLESHVSFKNFHTRSIIEGFAWKKGGIRRNWKRRYFTLLKDPPVMTYVAKKGHPKLLGSVNIDKGSTVAVENTKGFLLKLTGQLGRSRWGGTRSFYVKFQDEKQRNQWQRGLTRLIEFLNNPNVGMDKLSNELLENPLSSSGVFIIKEEKEEKGQESGSSSGTPQTQALNNPSPPPSIPNTPSVVTRDVYDENVQKK